MVNSAIRKLVMHAASDEAARRGHRWCIVGMVIAVTLGAIGGAYVASRPFLGGLTTLSLFLSMIALGMVVAEGFFTMEGLYGQRRRDLRAQNIWHTLRDGGLPEEPYVLYLRPFSSTDAMSEVKISTIQVQTGTKHLIFGTDNLEFETQIERAVRPIGTMVGLGRPLEHEGAGRITLSDDIWKEAISALMANAELIIMLPSPDGGTRWEVETLLGSELMRKTVIIDPPNNASRRKDYDPVGEWTEARRVFSDKGFALPEDEPGGQLIWFGANREPSDFHRLSLDEVGEMRRFFKRIAKRETTQIENQNQFHQ
ncbi:MAG: hypothetical protein AAF950_02655 [Pseudomonadota bacterium]